MKYAAFLGVRFEPEWYEMDPAEREAFEAEHIFPVLSKHSEYLHIRPFRAAGLGGPHTNFFLVHFAEVPEYHQLIEDLLERPLLSRRLATITDSFIGIEAASYAEKETEA
ncbi:hypothetical protein [Streptomyces sp. 891-h]|uniref:hypothetical protein n=1 Tax=unclassified Streptomyces TaxID=2593676 RepID=UPI001FAA2DCA|nr:hypothetical protein [Streptomyces sp. 891-h]UNZ20465.1 hypothetical protein HC362_28790 [Streptomyces sp. 891-h]